MGELNEKIKRKAHVKQSFSLDFLERGTFTEYPWIEPVPGMENMIQGISLKTDGKASSINMATLQYEKWEQKDNLLILSGTSIGNHQTLSFTDTLKIEKLTKDSLIIRKGELVLKYSKVNKEFTPM